jgi:hypothetical protein
MDLAHALEPMAMALGAASRIVEPPRTSAGFASAVAAGTRGAINSWATVALQQRDQPPPRP